MADAVKRKLHELRVVDLRAELEIRGLDKTGGKATLLERLEQSLKTNGDDPETFQFMVVGPAASKKVPKKRKGEMNEPEGDDDDDDEQVLDASSDLPAADRRVNEETSVEPTENSLNRSTNDDGDEELVVGLDGGDDINDIDNGHIKVPNPENVEPQCPFTSDDTIKLHEAATEKKKLSDLEGGGISDEANSLFVNADETLSDLDQTETSSLGASLLCGNDGGRGDFKTINETSSDDVTRENDSAKGTFDEGKTPKNASSPPVLPTSHNEIEKTSSVKIEPKKESVDASDESKEKKTGDKSVTPSASTGKSIWVMGISVSTKAADLKSLFSKYGRVSTAKVISSKTKVDGPRWFGFITMVSADDASKCIQHLHRTELHGKMISVERTSSNSTMPPKKVFGAISDGPASKKPTPTSVSVAPISSSSGESHVTSNNSGAAASSESNLKPTKGETAMKPDEKDNNDDKTIDKPTDVAEKKKDDTADKAKDRTDKRGSKSRTRSRSKDRRRPSSKERRSRDREMARRRELASRQQRRPFVPSSRPPFRPPRPLMSGRFQRPPPSRPPPRPHTDYRSREDATLQRVRLLEMRTERERNIIERMRQKDAEHKRREEVLRLEREKERLKFEREKLEREKAELQYQHKQILLQAAYEQRLQQQPPSLIGVKRSYGDMSAYTGPEPKRYAGGSSGVGGARGGGRDRTPPRYAGGSSRDTSRNDRYDSRSSRVDQGGRSGGRDDYRAGGSSSSSSRRPEPVRSSRVGERRFSPPRRGREPPPPPPPPRPNNWGASSSSASSRHVGNAGGGGSGSVRDNRVTSSSSAYSSRQSGGGYNNNRGPPPTAPAPWPGAAPIVQGQTWGRPGQLQAAVSTGVWAPQPQTPLFGGVASNPAPSNSSYGTENRFDAYKYNSTSSVRRY